MSFIDLLIHTCTIKRHGAIGTNSYGTPTYSWVVIHADEPCRLVSRKGREIKVGAEVVISDWELFLQDIDITAQDTVEIDSVEYEVLLVEPHSNGVDEHHKEAMLQVVDAEVASAVWPLLGVAFPASPVEGEIFYRTDTDRLYIYADA